VPTLAFFTLQSNAAGKSNINLKGIMVGNGKEQIHTAEYNREASKQSESRGDELRRFIGAPVSSPS
jgi:hypothetical protein